MNVFRKKEKATGCCCGGKCDEASIAQGEAGKQAKGIKILGSGCAKCNALEEATRLALTQLEMDVKIEHITDFVQIATYGVMSTPALVVDGKVVSYGKVLSKDEVIQILKGM